MPSRPYVYQLPDASSSYDLSSLSSKIKQTEESRQEAYDTSRKIQIALLGAKRHVAEDNHPSNAQVESLIMAAIPKEATRDSREANLSFRVEDYVRHCAFLQFIHDGTLISRTDCQYATDEEYLAGACMGLSQDLARYGLGRATARDAESVQVASQLVQEILEYLLQFDFRNGPLRRKYDGTKYALKNLETLLYELAVTGGFGATATKADDDEEPASKRVKTETLLSNAELIALRERMEHRDALRENLIKKCRDGQKAAKQAIYALHRGDYKKAQTLLVQCENWIQKDLFPIVQEEPPLRHGSFSNLLEEYVEGKLFQAWLLGRDYDPETPPKSAKAVLLSDDEFAGVVALEPMEYLGGLCDLTGEVGRYAVQRATVRDSDSVKVCLATNKSILDAIEMMERQPHGFGKKMEPLRRSVEKLERILYEMSLSEAAGGRQVQAGAMDGGDGGAMDESKKEKE